MTEFHVRCLAEARDGKWEAICLDFDLAAQADSFPAVKTRLKEAIDLHVESLEDLSEADRVRLLRRRAPWCLWVKYVIAVALAKFHERRSGGEYRHTYTTAVATY